MFKNIKPRMKNQELQKQQNKGYLGCFCNP